MSDTVNFGAMAPAFAGYLRHVRCDLDGAVGVVATGTGWRDSTDLRWAIAAITVKLLTGEIDGNAVPAVGTVVTVAVTEPAYRCVVRGKLRVADAGRTQTGRQGVARLYQ